MDKEYVDRKLVEDSVRSVRGSIPSGDPVINVICNTITEKIVESVGKLQKEDVSPVMHGRWLEEDGYQICSNCGDEHSWDEYRASFCECCGAKMDLEVGE